MGKVILITGISSGFGKVTAQLLAGEGHKVYGTVRRESDAVLPVNILKLDLTDKESIRSAVEVIKDKEGRIDVLINNAGIHTGGPAETVPAEHAELQMNTNFFGMVYLSREVLPLMRKQGSGLIINISSIGGLMGLPFQSFYSAAKFAVEGFSQALSIEVRNFNIRVVVVNPGDFRTNNSANRRNFLAPAVPGNPYNDQFERALSVIENDEANGWNPEVLAARISRIVNSKNPRYRYIVGSLEQRLAVMLKQMLPDRLFLKILGEHYKVK